MTKLPTWLKDPDVVLLSRDYRRSRNRVYARRINTTYGEGNDSSRRAISINRSLWWVVSIASDTRTHGVQIVITPMLGTDLRYRGDVAGWVPYKIALDTHGMSAREWLEEFT